MSEPEMLFFWITVTSYVLVTLLYINWITGSRISAAKAERALIWSGFLANTAVVVTRTVTSGHLPVRTLYELNVTVAWLIVGVYLTARRVYSNTSLVGLISVPFAFLVMGWGYAENPAIEPLTAAYKSSWLAVHVLFALLSTACYVFATGTSIMYLLRNRFTGAAGVKYRLLPDPADLDRISVRLVMFGFLSGTIMLLSGSIWAKLLWGSYWSWDPVETWSLISWLVYGIYLHLYSTFGWRGNKLAWLCLGCLATNIISFWAVGIVTPDTYHNLELITRPVD
ncbi:MAG: cytochrome C biogenesis protein [Firmicutes bacterium HGW-Firmicutes-14]|nr:MAG: cytochrome C biogenesis protein [Firmicutes bacterium HGW-Firmicutes-14]